MGPRSWVLRIEVDQRRWSDEKLWCEEKGESRSSEDVLQREEDCLLRRSRRSSTEDEQERANAE